MKIISKNEALNFQGLTVEIEGRRFNVTKSDVLGMDYREIVKNPRMGFDQKKVRAKGIITKLNEVFNANFN